MKEIKVQKLSWEERYKRMMQLLYASVFCADEVIEENLSNEQSRALRKKYHADLAYKVGKTLVQKYNLEPTVEGALKLYTLYDCEIYGYGADEYVTAELENPNQGIFTISACRGWEIQKREGKEELMKKMDCGLETHAEHEALVKALNPELKVKMTKAYPWGDKCCQFVIEK